MNEEQPHIRLAPSLHHQQIELEKDCLEIKMTNESYPDHMVTARQIQGKDWQHLETNEDAISILEKSFVVQW